MESHHHTFGLPPFTSPKVWNLPKSSPRTWLSWPVISPIALLWILLSSLPASKPTKPRQSSLWSWKTMIVCIGENGLVALLGSSFCFMPSKFLSSKELLNKNLFNKEKHPSWKAHLQSNPIYQGPQIEHDISDIFPLPCHVNVLFNSKKAH